jgi:predicted patatin/cPLA2 family phospholipase
MKSTKYQLLEADYESLKRQLKQYRDMIEQLRKENEDYTKTLTRIKDTKVDSIIYQCWAEIVLHTHGKLKS